MAIDQTNFEIDQYYKLNLQHLKLSFGSSLFALFVGLAALLMGVWAILQGNSGLSPQLSIIGGVLTEFIGAGFFYLYSKNLNQLNIFYQKLIKKHDTFYAISLASQIPDQDKASVIKAIVGSLLSRDEPPTPPEVLKAPDYPQMPTHCII
jgi:hypothetical protein